MVAAFVVPTDLMTFLAYFSLTGLALPKTVVVRILNRLTDRGIMNGIPWYSYFIPSF